MTKLPKLLLNFLAVDYPGYMRKPALFAMAEAAEKYGLTIVAVNRPLCPYTTLITKPNRFGELLKKPKLEKLAPNLYLFSPKYWLHDHLAIRVPGFQKLNQSSLKKSYAKLQARLNISEPNPLVWFNYPEQGYVMDTFPKSFSVYELYDQLADGEGKPLTKSLILQQAQRDQVDLLLTTSALLQENYSPQYQQSYFFGNGLSRASFNALSDPSVKALDSILKIQSPRIGYAGMISSRLDLELISSLASKRPDWNFVLVGPTKDATVTAHLSGHQNIHLLKAVKQDQIPSVLKAFDLGFLPYVDNDFSNHINPLKFYEMAAAGLCQVASATKELASFPETFVKVVPNKVETWENAIAGFLDNKNDQTNEIGRQLASGFIWENMSDKFLLKLQEYFSR